MDNPSNKLNQELHYVKEILFYLSAVYSFQKVKFSSND